MHKSARVFHVLIASPSDVKEERGIVREALYEWNSLNSKQFGVVLLPVCWEIDIYPEMEHRPQEIINKQIVNDADFLVGIFWSRLGTSTGLYPSGTIEELSEFKNTNKPAMVYFAEKPFPYDCDVSQITKIKEFKNECQKKGIICTYRALSEFKEKILRNLTQLVFKVVQGESNIKIPISSTLNYDLMNTYSYSEDKDRLRIQADSLKKVDASAINYCIKSIKCNKDERIHILDIGCADGLVTIDRFAEFGDVLVTGIDKDSIAIDQANRRVNNSKLQSTFLFNCADIDNYDIPDNKYDIIFSALTLHHLTNPEGVLKKLWASVKSGGFIIIRASDDGLKLNYPNSPELDFLLHSTNKIAGSSDRQFGRKLYTYAKRLEPSAKNIKIFYDIQSTENSNSIERINFFEDNYSFRSKYAERATRLFTASDEDKALAETLKQITEKQKIRFTLEEDLFSITIQNILVAQKTDKSIAC